MLSINPEALFGELAFFREVLHYANISVLEELTELMRDSRASIINPKGDGLSERISCRDAVDQQQARPSQQGWINLLLDGMQAYANTDSRALEPVCNDLSQGPTGMADAAKQLRFLLASMATSTVSKA